MLRLILLVLVIAGVAGYFTRPSQAELTAGAEAVLRDVHSLEDLGDAARSLVGNAQFSDYYVATRYVVTQGDKELVGCWGVFTQVHCTRAAS